MRDIFVVSDNIFSPIGSTTAENFDQLKKNISGIRRWEFPSISPDPMYASLLPRGANPLPAEDNRNLTRFEQLLIASLKSALQSSDIQASDPRTLLIVSTTKGNISLLETEKMSPELEKRLALHHSARRVAEYFHCKNKPIIVSQACISGLLAIITGMRLLQSGAHDHALIVGADLITKFIWSGFQSFQAISPEPCRPFDANRKGISLGDGAATIVLSATAGKTSSHIRICGGSVTNDANHISGPSRTGEELFLAIRKTLAEAKISPEEVDFISAHGTATIYNDEMEAKAINLANLQSVPVNSLKGFYGHTLGAAGLIESIVSIQSLKEGILIPTKGYNQPGTSKPIRVSNQLQEGKYRKCLKTASGFGGCNAAILISKED
ncbi:MAG: beta-ketoacyl-[acyl-carrier-protein] synthase family protein [Chitinophagales bacterium]